MDERLSKLEKRVDKLSDDIATVLIFVQRASGLGGVVSKHGPRVFAAGVGYLVATQKIDQSAATFLGSIFGVG